MKCKIIIDPLLEEELVLIYAHERNSRIEEIEKIAVGSSNELIGYEDRNTFSFIDVNDVECFFIESNKVFAFAKNKRFLLKQRLYSIESTLDNDFIKINQSCIANIKKIERFEVSFSGALLVIFKNGHKDYVSRRQMKAVKERIGVIK